MAAIRIAGHLQRRLTITRLRAANAAAMTSQLKLTGN